MHLLFVCTGNTCRSPMAEAIARQIAAERSLGITTGSAGTSAWEGAPASDGALLVAMERGLDLNGHRARALTPQLVAASDLIFGMSPHHRERANVLGGDGRTHLLTDYAGLTNEGRPVLDPFGGDLDTYRQTFTEMQGDLVRVFDRIAAERGARGT